VLSILILQVFDESNEKRMMIWNYEIVAGNMAYIQPFCLSVYEDTDLFPTMPWLDPRHCHCNCSEHQTGGTVLRNLEISTLEDNGVRSEFDNNDTESEEISSDDSYDDEDDDDDPDNDSITHTLPFKVIGVAHSLTTQNHLEECLEKMTIDHDSVKVRVTPEPDNEKDRNAISVEVNYSEEWKHVGYIASNLTTYVHNAIQTYKLIACTIEHIKFRVHFARPGLYMKLLITKQGA